MLCGIQERYTIADVLAGRRSVQETLESSPAGVRVLAGAWELGVLADGSATAQQRLLGQLKGLRHLTEVVVVDVGNSWSRWTRRFWQAADRVLLVTTSELAAIMDTYASVKSLAAGQPGISLELVVNMAADADVAQDVERRLTRACQRFLGLRLNTAGHLPYVAPSVSMVSDLENVGGLASSAFLKQAFEELAKTVAARIELVPIRSLSAA